MSDSIQPAVSNTLEIEESPGVISSMRVLLRSARRAGWVMIVSGILLAGAIFVFDRGYQLVTFSILLVSTGSGMITGLGFAKAIQARSENQ
jgi:hypothetical protein